MHSPRAVFALLLNTAQYEFVLKEMFKGMLAEKQSQWDRLRREASDRMKVRPLCPQPLLLRTAACMEFSVLAD